MDKTHFLIINPAARSGRGRKKAEKITETFKKHGVAFDWRFSMHKGQSVELAKEAREKGYETVVACGGDGTICEVISGLFKAQGNYPLPNLGIIHIGTSPDFNKLHKIPIIIPEAITTILRGQTRTIDIIKAEYSADRQGKGKVTGFFASNANIGLGPLIISRTNSRYRKYLGDFLGTLAAMLSSLIGFKPFEAVLHTDRETFQIKDAINITVGKDPYIGSGMRVFSDVKFDDGEMYVLTVKKTSWRDFLSNLPRIYTGNFLKYEGASITYAQKTHIEFCRRYPFIEFDGDLKGYLPLTMEVLPRALKIIV